MAGWKVALTLPVAVRADEALGPGVRRHLPERRPPERRRLREGLADQGRHRMRDGGAHVEGRAAGGAAYTAETIRPFVANLYCGAEVVENRYADVTKVSGPGRIADDVLQAACIVGSEIKDWQKLDFAGLKGRSEFEGKEIGAGPGHQRHGRRPDLARLARQQADRATASTCRRAIVILTGSVHPPVFLPGPGIAKTEFVGLGGIGDHDQIRACDGPTAAC